MGDLGVQFDRRRIGGHPDVNPGWSIDLENPVNHHAEETLVPACEASFEVTEAAGQFTKVVEGPSPFDGLSLQAAGWLKYAPPCQSTPRRVTFSMVAHGHQLAQPGGGHYIQTTARDPIGLAPENPDEPEAGRGTLGYTWGAGHTSGDFGDPEARDTFQVQTIAGMSGTLVLGGDTFDVADTGFVGCWECLVGERLERSDIASAYLPCDNGMAYWDQVWSGECDRDATQWGEGKERLLTWDAGVIHWFRGIWLTAVDLATGDTGYVNLTRAPGFDPVGTYDAIGTDDLVGGNSPAWRATITVDAELCLSGPCVTYPVTLSFAAGWSPWPGGSGVYTQVEA